MLPNRAVNSALATLPGYLQAGLVEFTALPLMCNGLAGYKH